MTKDSVQVGSVYLAMVSGRLVQVRLNAIRKGERRGYGKKNGTFYDVTNLSTGRELTFKSATKLRPYTPPKAEREAAAKASKGLGGFVTSEEARKLDNQPTVVLGTKAASPPPPVTVTEETPSGPTYGSKLSERLAAAKARRDVVDTAPHLIVEARAGTGKTTTLIEGLRQVRGETSTLIPSPQQAAVWESMKLSSGKVQSICFCAFNKSIATELQSRMPSGCNAMTLHSMGFAAVRKAFGNVKVDSWRVTNIISEILEKDIRELRKFEPVLVKATEELVGLCKQNLIYDGSVDGFDQEDWATELDKLAAYYDVDLNGSRSKVFDLVPKVLERCRDVKRDNCIDFNDMIWLPVALNLPCAKYDLLLVDEAQDLNRCQQQLALRSGRRLILCGDPRQAIYGFAGADADSMPRMAGILGETERGCVTLPLTVTRRCGKNIVEEARRIVPDFEAFATNKDGRIGRATFDEPKEKVEGPDGSDMRAGADCSYRGQVQDGDFLLCRVNAPLVSQCFRFLKEGRKAVIQGRDVGQGLISTVKKLVKNEEARKTKEGVIDFITALESWFLDESKKENAKRNPSEARLIALQDRKECLECFAEGAESVEGIIAKIETIFTDNGTSGIRLSSIHKAKGLEARRVFLLEPKGATVPHPMAKSDWQRGQEMNLRYVAITRAIEELVYVS